MSKKPTVKTKSGVKFNAKLQTELESLITESSQTQLEGIRQKVFLDRYALKGPSGDLLEEYPEPFVGGVSHRLPGTLPLVRL